MGDSRIKLYQKLGDRPACGCDFEKTLGAQQDFDDECARTFVDKEVDGDVVKVLTDSQCKHNYTSFDSFDMYDKYWRDKLEFKNLVYYDPINPAANDLNNPIIEINQTNGWEITNKPDFRPKAPNTAVGAYEYGGDNWIPGYHPVPRTRIAPTPQGEPNLLGPGGVLDVLYGLENLGRIFDNVDELWLNHGGGTATAKATYTSVDIPGSSQKGRQFGYFRNNDTFKPIMTLDTAQALDSNGLASAGLPDQEQLPVTRWGIDRGDDPLTSRASDNDGVDHMTTWLVTKGPSRGNYVLAWEDFDTQVQGFNDLVVEVSKVAPVKQTPVLSPSLETELHLLGTDGVLDTLYGLENLERISDTDDQYWTRPNGDRYTAQAQAKFGDLTYLWEILAGMGIDGSSVHILTRVLAVEGDGLAVTGSGGRNRGGPQGTAFTWRANGRYSSVPYQNPDGADHLTTWSITDGPSAGEYVLAWEDRDIPPADQDYQDMVIDLGGDIRPNRQVNDRVALLESSANHTSPGTGYPAGLFTIIATFKNTSQEPITNPFFGLVDLSGGNQLVNSDSGRGGTLLSVDAGDGVWSPGEKVEVTFEIGLQSQSPFRFLVDLFEGGASQ